MAPNKKILKGITRLGTQIVDGMTTHVEQMHETIARRPAPWAQKPHEPTRSHGLIAAVVYDSIRAVNDLVGKGLDSGLSLLPDPDEDPGVADKGVNFIAALNGICGDHLASNDNPLAIPMQCFPGPLSDSQPAMELDREAIAARLPAAGPDIVLLVHGLCMSDLQWQRNDRDLGRRLLTELGLTPLYLRYNTGRHISENGRELSALLETLCAQWPVPLRSITLIGHSMGGLVLRSAGWYAEHEGHSWLRLLKRKICLGSPHHGAPLEQAGQQITRFMQAVQYLEPLAFGQYRSAGIQDLRYGNLLDEDWQDMMTDEAGGDHRRPVPLLKGVAYYFAAAVLGPEPNHLSSRLFGDMLVRLGSATGRHRDAHHRLPVPEDHCRVFHETSHFHLLYDPAVHAQVVEWCRDPSSV